MPSSRQSLIRRTVTRAHLSPVVSVMFGALVTDTVRATLHLVHGVPNQIAQIKPFLHHCIISATTRGFVRFSQAPAASSTGAAMRSPRCATAPDKRAQPANSSRKYLPR
eukprot:2759950-Heterocapsa_arctica.AAC.1